MTELGVADVEYAPSIATSTPAFVDGLELPGIEVAGKPLLFELTLPQGIESTSDGDIICISLQRDGVAVDPALVARLGASKPTFVGTTVIRDMPEDGVYDYRLAWSRLSGSGTCFISYTGTPFFTRPSLRCIEEEVA